MRRLLPALVLALLSWGCVQRDVISVTIAQIVVQPAAPPMLQGQTLQFNASVQDANGRAFPRAAVEWAVDAPEIVTIDSEGMATAVSPGNAQIQATFRGVMGTATVRVIAAPSIDVDPDSAMIFGAAGAGPPQPAVLQIRNGGGGSLSGLQTEIVYSSTPEGWLDAVLSDVRAPATVTLSATIDGLAVGDYDATLVLTSPDDESGPTLVPVVLSLTGFSVTETGGGTSVGESGTTDTLSVVLDAPPDTTVVLNVTSGDPTEVSVAPATLTFTPTNWSTPRTVVVSGVDEVVADGDKTVDVSVTVDADLSDDRFDPVPAETVDVTSIDDDTPDVTIVQTGGNTTVGEDGSTDQFTVVLDVEPLSPVVFDVARSDPTEASAGPTTITFTPADWATPQTVTVTGVDDDLIDGDVSSVVTITVDAGLSDDAFDTLAPDTVDLTTVDDDVAGFLLVESAPTGGEALSEVSEDGGTDDFTVVLTARPATDVTLTLTPADPGEVTTSPTSVTFTTDNWDTPTSVTLQGVDDDIIDGPQSTLVTISVDDASSDDDFDAVPDTAFAVVTTDDDQAGVTIAETGGGTSVTEAGSTDQFTLVLTAQPASDVVLDLTSADTGEVTVAPTSVTFSPAGWDTPQTVTVTGVDELIDDGDALTNVDIVVDASASDDDFDLLPADSVVVTTVDDDTAGWIVTESGGGTLVSEDGTTDDFDIVLTSEPVDTVVLTLLASDPSEASVAPLSLTFSPTNWNVPQTVTVTGVNDVLNDDNQFSVIAIGVSQALSDAAYDPLPDQTVQVTTTDNDSPAGFTVTAIGGTTVTEAGGTDEFTVVLDTEPASDVVFDLTSSDVGEITLGVSTLTFTSADWDTPQTVTVTGVDDNLVDGPQASTLTVSVNDLASDDAFDVLADQTLPATTTDDDVPGFTTVESDGNTLVGESGTTDDVSVVLDAQPALDVQISITSGDLGEASVAPATLTFTPANWNVAQTVTVTGVDDVVIDGSQLTTVTLAVVDAASDDAFDAVADQTISVQTTDNDVPGISIAESDGTTVVSEAGSSDDISVVLDSEPTADVVLDVVVGDATEITAAPLTLTFTNANWDTPQTVTLTGVDDFVLDGDVVTTVDVNVNDALSDDGYDGLTAQVGVTTTDDDGAGMTVTETGPGSSVSEAGGSDTFSVVLDARPASAVILDITSGDPGEVAVSPTQVTFTVTSWNVPQVITLTGVDDALTDGDQVATVTVSVNAAASDDDFDAVPDETVTVTNADDDVAGFAVAETGGSTTVAEAGGQDEFTVVLLTQPVLDVVLDIVGSEPDEAVVSPTTLTFTAATWDTPQTVTVTGVNDNLVDGNQPSIATISVNPGSDPDFLAAPDQVVAITTIDDDAAAFSVTESAGESVVSEAGLTDDLSVVLAAQPTSNVVLTVASANTAEVTGAPGVLTFTPANWNTPQTVTLTGVDELIDDGDQSTDITIAVDAAASDDAFDATPPQVVAVITLDNDVAGITVVQSAGGTLVSEAGSTDDFTVVLDTEPVSNVVIDLESEDTTEATVTPTSLIFTPANWSVPQTVTVTGVDDLDNDDSQFSNVTVSVNAPTSDDAYDSVLPEIVIVTTTDDDAPAGVTVTAIGGTTVSEAGSSDDFTVVLDTEPGSNVVLDITSGDPGEAAVSPATLTFTPANWDQSQTVTVTGVDDNIIDGSQNTDITVSVDVALSDVLYDPVADQTVPVVTTDDDVAGFTVTETGGSTVVNESGTTDAVTVALTAEPGSNVQILVSSADVGEATVSPILLVFTPATWDTPQTVTVTGADDAVLDGPQVTTLTFAIDDPNSDDDFDAVADQTVDATTTDDDAPGLSVMPSGGSTDVAESGTTDTFTVMLSAGPNTDVVVDVTSGDTGEATVAPATLTFTAANWDTPQTVTVTGVDDALFDGDQLTTITVAVDDAASDDDYDGLSETLQATTTDDDAPGFVVVESGPGTSVQESGTSDDFTVALSVQPNSPVSFDITSADASEVTVAPATLTFTPATWDTPQTVTVTGVDDPAIDGDQLTDVTIAVDALSSDPNFGAVPSQIVAVTTFDDDLAGYAVVETGAGTLVSETGTTDDFTVVLTTQPASDVVFDIASDDPGESSVAPLTLTFDGTNWDTPQTVTVTGVDDPLIDGNQLSTVTVSVNAAASDDNFDALGDETVSVTTTSDDVGDFVVTESGGGSVVTEAGGSDDLSVVLAAQPATDVVLTVTSANTSEVTATPSTLTFTSANWNTPQTVTLAGVDELIDDGDQSTDVTVAVDAGASDDDFDAAADQVIAVTTTDDDVAGITLVETANGTLVTEAGSTDDFTVVLDTEPTSDVVLDVASADIGEATAAPASLTFTPANWNTPQTVTVTGVDDLLADGSQFTDVSVSVDAAASDDVYDPVAPEVVTVTTTDNDAPAGVTVTAIGGTTVTEAGSSDDFTVVLDTEPGSNVVLDITSGDPGEASVAPATLTFTSANWDTPQTVTVTGVDDDIIDGSQNTDVTVSVDAALSDDLYDPVPDETVPVVTTDNDVAGFLVTETGGSTVVNESGTTDDVTVELTAEPASNVQILVSSADVTEATVSPILLVFTPTDWDTPQTVTVTGADDLLLDGTQVTTLTFSIDPPNSDDDFDAVADQTVDATTTDDDTAGLLLTPSDGLTIMSETGTTDDFTVVLTRGPASNVVVDVTSGDTGEATVAPAALTFTPANWDTPQTVTVTGVDDAAVDGDQSTTITVAVDDAASDDLYDGLSETIDATTTDDDGAGLTITETGGSTAVQEPGTTDQVTVVLDAQPATNVVINLTSEDLTEVTVSPATLTFTNLSWSTPQTVTLTAVDDDIIDGPQTTTLTLAIDDLLSDDAYDPLPDQTGFVVTADDDVAGFVVTESGGGSQVSEGGGVDDLSVVLTAQPASDVVLDVSSADLGEVTVAPLQLTFTPATWNTPQILTLTGVDDAIIDGSQATDVTFSIDPAGSDDDFDAVLDQAISVTTTDDDGPGFSIVESGGDTQVNEAGGSDSFTVVLDAQPATDVVLNITAADATEASVDVPSLTFTSANWNAPQTVTVTGVDDAVDDGPIASAVVVSVDDAASDDAFDAVPDQNVTVTTLDDDTAGFTVTQSGGTTSVTESGSTDAFTVVLDTEPVSNVEILVSGSDATEATVVPASLTFTPADWDTPQTVTVTGVDDLFNDGPQISVVTLSVNDGTSDDTFDPLPDQTVSVTTIDDDQAGFTIVQTDGGTSVSESGTTDDFTVVLTAQPGSNVVLLLSNGDPSEVSVSAPALTFTPANWNTPQTVTVTGVDDAFDDGDRFTVLTISVDDANSDNAYDPLADQTVSVTTLDDDGVGFVVTQTDGNTVVTEAGGTDSFDVVLSAQPPTSDVVLDISSADVGEATVSPATLTFSTTDWDTPQTVTVTGVDDLLDDGDVITLVSISVDAANSDDTYDAVATQTIGVTTIDDDGAGFTVTESGGSTLVSEAGTSDGVTVVLGAQPATNVVITVTPQDAGEVSALPIQLTFTNGNWDTPQPVTLTGVDDDIDDGDVISSVVFAVDDLLSDDVFDGLPDQTVSVTTADDDVAGFTLAESGGGTSVTEAGSSDSFTIVLTSQPVTNVVFDVSSDDTGEATVGASTVVFTPSNWDTPQTVTVTGVDDAVDDGDQTSTVTVAVNAGASDDAFDALPSQTVSVTTIDDDGAGFALSEPGGFTTVSESGTQDIFNVVLSAQPVTNVVLTVTSADAGEVTAAPTSLTFTPGNWNTPQPVTVTGVDDVLTDGDVSTDVVVAVDDANSDDAFDPLPDQAVSVTTTDDDVAGYTLTETGGTTVVSEAGTTDGFNVVLTTQPIADVVFDVVSADPGEVTAGVAQLTFTPANWDTPQTVTVTGVDDVIQDGPQITAVSVTVDPALSDDDFDALPAQSVNVTTNDDDAAFFTVTPSGGTTDVTEAGTTDLVAVVLGTQPTSDVVFTITSADLSEATVAPATLTFTTLNWDTPQNVTVTGVDDQIVDGPQTTLLTIAVDDANSDDAFDPLADQTTLVTTADDDVAAFTIAETGGNTTVSEAGTTDTFTLVLDRQPLTNVVFDVSSADVGEVTVAPGLVTFTPANWDTPQTVTATGVDDGIDDGDVVTLLTVSVNVANSDDAFDGLAPQTVSATTTDDDDAGFVVTESGGSSAVSETGTTDDVTVVLSTQPTSNVVFDVTSADVGEVSVAPAQVTFTPADWDQPRTVTLTGVDDDVIDGTVNTNVTLSVNAAASDDAFDLLADQTVVVATSDDDVAGFTVTETGATTVSEAGTTDNFTVVLDVEPASDVVITVTSADVGEATVSPATLTFTNADWDTPQTVTVTGIDDLVDDGDQNTTVTLAVDDASSDDAFDALADQTVSVTTVDDDGAGFTVVESGGGTSVTEAGSSDSFTVVLTAQPATPVRLTVSSADVGEATVDVADLQFNAGNWDTPQTVTITGVDDLNDDGNVVTAITLSVDDATSDDAYDPVPNQIVSVITVDDDIAGFTVVESGGQTLVSETGTTDDFTVVLTAAPVTDVVLNVTSDDPGEATVAPAALTFTSANWNVAQTVTVTGVDDALVDNFQFSTITIAVDDAASDDAYDPLASQVVGVTTTDDESAGYTVTETAGTTIVAEAGGTDVVTLVLDAQPFGNVVLNVVSSDPTEATVSTASVIFNNANWNTPQNVTVTGVPDDIDDGDQTPTVTFSVNTALTEDSFDGMGNQVVTVTVTDDDAAGVTLAETSGSTVVAESGTTDAFTVVLESEPVSNVVLDVVSPDVTEVTVDQPTLTFTPANWDTPQTIVVAGVDDLVDDGNVITLVSVSVDAAQSDDAYDPLGAQTVAVTTTDDDGAGISISETAGSTSVDESGTTDSFTVTLDAQPLTDVVLDVTSGDTGEATVDLAVLTFTTTNWNTPQSVTVTGVDDLVDDGDQSTTITVSVDPAQSDDAYDAVPDETVIATTVDDDGAGYSSLETGGSTTVDESGTTDTFTVSIASEPVGAVVIDVTSTDTGEVTVSPAQLTFTSANWLTAQTVTVTGVDDGSLVDGPVVTNVTLSINVAGSDAAYDGLANQQVAVTTTDNDLAGYTVTEVGGSTVVDEAGTTDDVTVVLTGQPEGNVVFDVSSADVGEVTVSPATLTFDNTNWNTPQTITVTGVDDAPLLDGDQVTLVTVSVDAVLSNDAFDPLADETVSVTTTDTGVAAFTVAESGTTVVSETGTTDNFTVVLDVQPTANVVFDVSSADVGEVTVIPATLTFTTGNWNTPQTVIVTGVSDSPLLDGDQLTDVTISVDAAASYDPFDAVADQTVSVTTTDADAAGVLVTESGGSTVVSESGSTDTFTVELTTQPLTDVTVDITSTDTGEATVDAASLVFTPANWDTPQTVTVTGVADSPLVDGAQATDVTVAVNDAASDDLFDDVPDQAVSVTTTDIDVASYTVTESGPGTTVAEDGAGNTDDFTVVLDAQPASDVVILVSSGGPGEALATPTSLTFTTANWNVAQTVTVTGVNDSPLVDGPQVSVVTMSIDFPSSDDGWDGVANQTVSVTTTDTDVAGFLITESGGSTPVTEAAGGGNTDDFTVVLTAQPLGAVVFDISSADTGEATVAPASLLFTNGNWNLPQTVTVTGVDDAVIDGPQNTLVTVSVNQPGTTPLFDAVVDQTVTVTTIDDDNAGFTVTESGGTTVAETGTSDSFTVVLDAEPASSVVIDVTSADTDEVTVSVASLTFLTSDWDTPQTVTVTGVDDDIDDGDVVTLVTMSIDDANSDDAFDPLADQSVSVTTVDDDAAGLTIVDGGGVSVSESGTNDTFTIQLATQPVSNVQLDLTSGDLTEATVSPATVTFTPANWDTPQTVTVTGVDDDLIDGDVGSTITVAVNDAASDDGYDPVADASVSVTTTDDDVAGLTLVEEAGATAVTEAGGTDTYTVALNAQPASNVVIALSSADTDEVTVSPATLTFTPANWDTPQTVTVTGVDDAIDDGDQITIVTAAVVDVSSDDAFDGLSEPISVTTIDDDTAGITVGAISGATDESGAQATFTVVLDTEPTASVSISVSSDDTTEGTVAPIALTFTPLTWSTPQTVIVTGQDDDIDDGAVVYSIVTAAATSTDAAYNGLDPANVVVTNNDDDTRGVTVGPISGNTSEPNAPATFTIVLDTEPIADVTIPLASTDLSEGTVAPASVTFTSANWDTPQTVTVTGVDDDIVDGPIGYQIATAPASSTDPNYNGFNAGNASVINDDDDVAGVTVSAVSGPTDEGGGTATFTLVLDSEPLADVTIDLSSDDTSEGTVAPTSVTFTTANWDTPRLITVTGVDDDVADGDVGYSIVTGAAVSGDLTYSGLAVADAALTNTDDDVAGFTVSAISGNTTEAGGTATFTIALTSQPLDDVSIALSSSDTGEGTVAPGSVTFTTANWNSAQTVTVTGVDDGIADGAMAFTIVTAPATSTDGSYNGNDPADVTVTNDDDDTAGITVSTISGPTTEAGGSATFTIVLDTEPTADVTIALSSSDPGEGTVSPGSVTFTSVNWFTAQTITVTGVDDDIADGNVAYSILTAPATSADPGYSTVDAADVPVTNNDDGDTAGITVGTISGDTDEAGGAATFTIVLDSEPTANVTVGLSSSDASEGSVAASAVFTPANWDTPQVITVTGVDDDLDDGDIGYTIVTAAATSTDGSYNGLNASDVAVTNIDDDTAGISVSLISMPTTEAGGTATFTIVLDSEPTASVSIGLTSDDTSEGTVSPSSVTFTTGNWDTPQTVTVTGVDDAIADGAVAYSIVTAAATSTDTNYNGVDPADVAVTNTDDESAGISVSPTVGLTTTEGGGVALFTIVLDSEPAATVTIGLSSSDTGEGTLSTGSAVFTTANWDTPQIITVTGIDDSLNDGDVAYTIVTAAATSTDGNYSGIDPLDVSITNIDNDTPDITLGPTVGSTSEAGGTATFTIVLDSEPTANVTIGLSSSDTSEGTPDVSSVVFTPATWNTPQTVTVTGVDDPDADGDIGYTIITAPATSTDLDYSGLNAADAPVINLDDDTPGITVSAISGNSTEAGGTATFTIELDSQPTDDVTIGLTSSDPGEGQPDLTSVVFTTGNWNTPQTVTVTGENDDIDDGNVVYAIVTAAATSTDTDYNGVDAADVAVTNTDDDTAGFTVGAISGNTTEAGGTATFTIVLDSEPTADVTVGLTSDDVSEGSVSPTSVTFTSATWNLPQTVTVTGQDDALADGDQTFSVVTAAATSTDTNYGGVDPVDVSVTNTDDEVAGLTIIELGPNTITSESGTTQNFTVELDFEPESNVVVTITNPEPGEVSLDLTTLTFTPADWDSPQNVELTGLPDGINDGDQTFDLTIAVDDANSANPFDGLSYTLQVTNQDIDP